MPTGKLWDAIHEAGRQLAALPADMLANLDGRSRVEYLKANILKFCKQVLQQDKLDIRLLNPNTNALEPLLTQGMQPEIAKLVLYALPDGNGISGRVAATGKMYYCPDVTKDPLNISGSTGSRTCCTVPLLDQEVVVGTMSIEGEAVDAFTEEQQAAFEEFGKEIGSALHTLKLLSTQNVESATRSCEMVSREIALPVDKILNLASGLKEQLQNAPEAVRKDLGEILGTARSLKETVRNAMRSVQQDEMMAHFTALTVAADSELRILVVDDEEHIRKMAHAVFTKQGCIVETVGNSAQARAMVCDGEYHLVLADIRMPDMNGYELFCMLRKEKPDLAIVITTDFGYDSSHSIIKARQQGLFGVLYKPFRMDQVVDILNRRRNGAVVTQG